MNPEVIDGFRAAMRRLTSTVSVVSCAHEDTWHGMTATAVTSVSADPPALLVCVNAAAGIHAPLAAGAAFCINILDSSQQAVSAAFSGQRRGRDRFAPADWTLSAQGIPYLLGAQANLFCTTQRFSTFATHGIFIATVEDVRVAQHVSPLLYQNGRYMRTAETA